MPLSRITSLFQSATANVYSPSANTVAIRTSSTDRFTVTSGGDVGIGTSSPSSKLHLSGATTADARITLTQTTAGLTSTLQQGSSGLALSASGSQSLLLETNGVTRATIDSSGNLGLGVTPSAWTTGWRALTIGSLANINSTDGWLQLLANAYYDVSGNYKYIASASTRATRYLQNGGVHSWEYSAAGTAGNNITFTQAMTLDASGQLGIGYTSMNTTLAVNGNALIGTGTWPTNAISRTGSRVALSSSTEDGVLIVTNMQSGVALGRAGTIYLGARATTGVEDSTFATVNGIKENATSGNYASALTFGTSIANGTIAEKARITSAGGFTCAGIYNTTVGATNRDVFVDNGGVVGYVSSIRASKTNIQDLTDTSWLHQLNPVTFNYRKKDEEGNYTEETDGDIQYGMIAEDVERVRPDLCFYDEVDGEQELRGIQYSKLVPVMLKEIQKLRAEIAALKGNA